MDKLLVVIAGPTAIGKTEVAISIAKKFNTEILSADARQLYKEMEIGTAKPSAEQLHEVKHHFINKLSITEDYNAGQYEIDALKTLEKIYANKDIAIMVGGSGLYINAVCNGFDSMPDANEFIRKELAEELQNKGLQSLQEELLQIDPTYYQEVDLANPIRIMRALEVYRITGKPYSLFRLKVKKERPFKIIKIGLKMDRKILYQRIDDRVDVMINKGLEEEVKTLLPYKDRNALHTVGYKEWLDYFDGKNHQEWVVPMIKQNTRHYAKRQMTWFNKDEEIQWFQPEEVEQIIAYVQSQIQ